MAKKLDLPRQAFEPLICGHNHKQTVPNLMLYFGLIHAYSGHFALFSPIPNVTKSLQKHAVKKLAGNRLVVILFAKVWDHPFDNFKDFLNTINLRIFQKISLQMQVILYQTNSIFC